MLPAKMVAENAKLAGRAYNAIEEQIVTLHFRPGQFLSEKTLANQFEIGRTPVREALQQLAREGLVKILPRRGVIVAEIDIKSQIDLLVVRREIERIMTRCAVARATDGETEKFARIGADIDARSQEQTTMQVL